MDIKDRVGKRGENIFSSIITRWCNGKDWFEEERFNAKTEIVDFLLNLIDPIDGRPQCYVQIKSTSQGYRGKGSKQKLKVNVSARDLDEMRKYPMPAYIVGIDIHAEKAFILGAGPATGAINGFPTTHPLDCDAFVKLWNEVQAIHSKTQAKDKTVFK